MNENPSTDKLLRLAPLVLRIAVAAVLVLNGMGRLAGGAELNVTQSVTADAAGVSVDANWDTVTAVAEFAIAGLLTIGWFTRLTTILVLGCIGYAASLSATSATGETINRLAELYQSSGPAFLFLGAACLSLLVSGPGCLGLDGRRSKRAATLDAVSVT
jgi:uncharacterized membrane protein YphA (DoxX/SURF4 family)